MRWCLSCRIRYTPVEGIISLLHRHTRHTSLSVPMKRFCACKWASVVRTSLPLPQSMSSLSLPPKVWQWMRESAAMTRMMPGAAEVMLDLSQVPLL